MAEQETLADVTSQSSERSELAVDLPSSQTEDAREKALYGWIKRLGGGRFIWSVVVLAWTLLLFAYLWPPDFRNRSTLYVCLSWLAFMLRTFLFHSGLAMCAIGVLAIFTRRWLLIGFIVPILCWTLGPSLWLCLPRTIEPHQGDEFTMMSVNLLMRNKQTAPIIAEVIATNPDVLLLQEYAPHWNRAFQNALRSTFPYVAHQNRSDSFGLAVYSKLPFANPPQLDLPLGESVYPQMRVVLSVKPGKDIAIYNLHLVPPSSLSFVVEHRLQLADLVEVLATEHLPMIAAGDFNFTNDSSEAAAIFDIGLHDAHAQAGIGRGSTWPNIGLLQWLPGVQIDHMFLDPTITATPCKTGQGQGSDHKPIVSRIVVP